MKLYQKLMAGLIVLLTTTICAAQEVVVIYINGANNTFDKSSVLKENQDSFFRMLDESGINKKNLNVVYDKFDNLSETTKASEVEFHCQADIAKAAFPVFGVPPRSEADLALYYNQIYSRYYTGLLGPLCAYVNQTEFWTPKTIFKKNDDLVLKIIGHIDAGRKVVLVGHSQGNFLIDSALATLSASNKYFFKTLSLEIGTFTPSALVRGRYFNTFQDRYVYDSVVSWLTSADYPPPANYKICILCSENRIATNEEIHQVTKDVTDDIQAHGIRTYINKNISVLPGIAIRTAITNRIKGLIYQSRPGDYVQGRLVKRNDISVKTAQIQPSLFDRLLPFFGINEALAQASPGLYAFINSQYVVTVTGDNFVGNERVEVEGSTCDAGSIRRESGYFSQRCVAGSQPGAGKVIRIIDSTYEFNLLVPDDYKYMTLMTPVVAPNVPTLVDLGSGNIKISWQPVSGASGYVVSRNGTEIAALGAVTTLDDAGRTYGSQICYRVRALANGVMSVFSPEACITPTAPAQCVNLWTGGYTPIGGSESTVQSCPSGQVGSITLYHLCQASGSGAAWSGTSTTNTCTIAPVPAPSGFSAARYIQGSTKGIRLAWNAVSGADSYFVYKLGVNGIYAPIGNQTSFIDILNLKSGVSYCYTVRAQSGNRVSVDSDVACSLAP